MLLTHDRILDGDDYVDYDSDFEEMHGITTTSGAGNVNVDPYSGEIQFHISRVGAYLQ